MEKFTSDGKKCTKCGNVKHEHEFYDGLSVCKSCRCAQVREYYHRNAEHERLRCRAYRDAHKDEVLEKRRKYHVDNIESEHRRDKEYYRNNREAVSARHRRWRESANGVASAKRVEAKRRGFGFKPLNERFPGSEFHHLHVDFDGREDHSVGIFIPREIHRSVYHDSLTWVGMAEINAAAIRWYVSHFD